MGVDNRHAAAAAASALIYGDSVSEWKKAGAAARTVLQDLDESELMGTLDEYNQGTWKMFQVLLSKIHGKLIPLLDRHDVNVAWRRVTLLVAEDASTTGELRDEAGNIVDEAPDTPGGVLQLYDGTYSLKTERRHVLHDTYDCLRGGGS